MKSRTRFLITAAFVCHLLVAPRLVTSQLRSDAQPVPPEEVTTQEVSIQALTQEKKGPVYTLQGGVVIRYSTYTFQADKITYNSETGAIAAEGHVLLEGGPNDEHVQATSAEYNIHTEVGRFENVHGTIGVRFRNQRAVLTSPNPFSFNGRTVKKMGPDHYRVFDGSITTCELPHPKWRFSAGKVVVDAGRNAKLYNSMFRVKGVPVFYLPFAYYPLQQRTRQSGFLLPHIGNSSIKGKIIGDSAYLTLGRTADTTVGADYYSRRGWAPQGEFRWRPSEKSFLDATAFAVIDRGIGSPPVKQGGQEVQLDGETSFHNFRGVADVDYLSAYVFRLAFYDVFSLAVNSEVKSEAFLSRTTNGLSLNTAMRRYQDFESTTPGDVVSILHMPELEADSVDRPIGGTPFYWSFDAAADGLHRSEPSFSTAPLLGRFDVSPEISLPLLWHGWSLRPALSLRDTLYTQQLQPSPGSIGTAVSDPINRKALEGSVELRPPSLERVFGKELFGRKWKHVIEPRVTYNYVTGVNNFSNILRFDERDILSDTNEVEYAIVNRIYAKRAKPAKENCEVNQTPAWLAGGESQPGQLAWEREPEETPACTPEPQTREIVSWELAQKYFLDPTFGGALLPGQRNVFTSTADLTGIAFLTSARHLSPLVSRLRVETSSRTDAEWDLDYDFVTSKINASTALMNFHLGQFSVGGGDALLQVPGEVALVSLAPGPQRFNQFRLLVGYGSPGKRGFSGAASVGFDANLGFLQYSAVQSAYNWDCCGLNLEYRRFALGSVRNENQYRFTFSLANIGALGNLKRQERLF